MMKICLYNPFWSSLGGGEKYVCIAAEVLSTVDRYDVTLLADTTSVTREQLSSYFRVGLDRVAMKTVPRRGIATELRSADLGIVLSNFKSFGNGARQNIYILQVPYSKITPSTILAKAVRYSPKEALKDVMRLRLLRHAREANLVIVYSEFTRRNVHHNHRINAQVLYPPIDDFKSVVSKENVILSVGRFFRGLYNVKRYDVLIEAFKKLRERLPHNSWQFRLVGSCGQDADSQRYLKELRDVSTGYPIYFYVNAPYEDLRRHYNEATIFWCATGHDIDEARYPERMEHFGMTTVEAMSAGCIPIVINKGGQREIVSHGKSGYLWNTPKELVDYSVQVMTNPGIVASMQPHVRQRFQDFNRAQFSSRLLSLIQQLEVQRT